MINLIEADINYLFIPKGTDFKFDEYVLENNTTLINETQKKNIINYPLEDPLSTYIDLKDLVLSLSSFSCPLLAPLGPKMFAAICVIISKEFDEKIPVWRVSSELTEKPMEREASGNILSLSIKI
ncbi:hypothetical protein CTM97_19320 [Photobacterium phosphoreum]|uniref:Uncharacterized protein n=1 Tax=Photobacterium phosphoreum TaxID=659 RepID=A0A2T3JPZ8_PHOPO|nr:hypothetical protein [Photobacterium phosphoreum]PSU24682.1 hypothetical protein CTM96_12135 [Photobacterium phosphoreum]PSU38242.1 hypothetical protein CTM97_19320 [Photobacterium phosphoreum]PSU51144.1 hypothetical protein C9J18_13195 [Photobacterium phosphoreum]